MILDLTTQILIFWFDDPTAPNTEYGQQRRVWFFKNPEFDQQVRSRFLQAHEQACQGLYDPLVETARGALALTVLFDQFPRNMFRETPKSFETDFKALKIAQTAIAQKLDQQLIPVERMFFYLPFEHSENIAHQNQAVSLFEALIQEAPELRSCLDYAYRHRDVIARFGRFPHRNAILGRTNTPAETEFLQQPGSRF
ncbi:DUF924 domain-containing protein [Oscillatoria sp. CS-180]|uniref:DUF924 family protein n=1 Tax=Oscillatoria sp. CS-180 TaxID=3021720 RepID=UPI00232BF826|nr:DUF924 family protein [Oscillatoria sp. CS-180]MDB9528501.1 DUF924 domain-containing protein [Oscillatoria sp. CS-180]